MNLTQATDLGQRRVNDRRKVDCAIAEWRNVDTQPLEPAIQLGSEAPLMNICFE
jgi:hypothetical protein